MGGLNGQSEKVGETHRKRTANLKPPWPKGVSGNPGGMKKGTRSITAIIRRLLDEGTDEKNIAIEMAKLGFAASKKGSFKHWKEILDRTDGPIKNQSEVDGKLEIVVRYVDRPIRHGISND